MSRQILFIPDRFKALSGRFNSNHPGEQALFEDIDFLLLLTGHIVLVGFLVFGVDLGFQSQIWEMWPVSTKIEQFKSELWRPPTERIQASPQNQREDSLNAILSKILSKSSSSDATI